MHKRDWYKPENYDVKYGAVWVAIKPQIGSQSYVRLGFRDILGQWCCIGEACTISNYGGKVVGWTEAHIPAYIEE